MDCDGIAKSPVLVPHEITRLPGLHEAFPPKATRKRLSYLTVLGLIWLQTDGLFEGFQKGVFGSVVYFDLFVIVGKLAEPVVWHFSGDWGRLSLVATADDLDAPTLQPVEEGFQNGAGHCADLVPDDHTGNEFLSHPFGRPFCLATPAEEAMIGLGLNAPGPHLFGQAMGRGEDEEISGTEELDRSRGFAAAPAAVYVDQAVPRQRVIVARRGAGIEVLFRTDLVRLGEVGCMFHGHVEILALVTPLGWGYRREVVFLE